MAVSKNRPQPDKGSEEENEKAIKEGGVASTFWRPPRLVWFGVSQRRLGKVIVSDDDDDEYSAKTEVSQARTDGRTEGVISSEQKNIFG